MKSICLALSAGVLLPVAILAAPSHDPAARPRAAADDGREAINGVLSRYVAAMQARDLVALKLIWPGMEESQATKIEEGFRYTRILRVELDVSDVQIDGRKAVVSCKRKDQAVTVEGQSFKSIRQATITLEKGGEWLISAIIIK